MWQRKLLCEFRGKNSKLKVNGAGGTWRRKKRLENYIKEHGRLQSMGPQRQTQTVNNNNNNVLTQYFLKNP